MCRRIFLSLLFVLPALAWGQETRGNLEAVLDAFIASIAKDHAEYKTDIRLWTSGAAVPPGCQLGRSASLGAYSFRPKTWKELSEAERATLLVHPQLKGFLVSLRNERTYPAVSAANDSAATAQPAGWFPVEGSSPKKPEYRIKLDPQEMVRNRPVVLPVTAVPAKE
ncbi:MAG: hypothetical protein PHE83_18435 [Opitutaceae bacterium]|nr:hypothetical protein [Opitutaceae bacterium]